VTLIGKIDEYISQLENAVNQLRQENQKLQEALQEKPASFRDEVDDEC
jgi:flagellar biosynthesis chaperone FliJ